jgi:hypothetical protein
VIRERLRRAVAVGHRLCAFSIDVDDALQREFGMVPDRVGVVFAHKTDPDDDYFGYHDGSDWQMPPTHSVVTAGWTTFRHSCPSAPL